MQEYTREELVELKPDEYLAEGWRDAEGRPRPEAKGLWVNAACARLMAAELSPQELAFTVDAIRLLLPEHDEPDPHERLHATVQEALEVVASAIQQRNNEGLLEWLSSCAAPVSTQADIDAFMEHLEAVRRQYALLVALLPDSPSSLPV